MLGHHSTFSLIPALGYRFSTRLRSEPYWRPRLDGRLHVGLYATPQIRVALEGRGQWLMADGAVEGGLLLHFQGSKRRGLRDFSPLAFPFEAALDSRVETQ